MKPLRVVLNIVLSLALLAAAGWAVWWMAAHLREPPSRERPRVVPKVLAPRIRARADQRVRIVGYGSARPRVQLEIAPQVGGTVVEKAAGYLSGKTVRAGQVLFRIDPTDYRLAVERVEKRTELLHAQRAKLAQDEKNLQASRKIEAEQRDLAQRQVDRVRRLLERGAASDNELDIATQSLLSRQAQLQTLLNQLALIDPQRAQIDAELASAGVELKQAQTNLSRCVVRSPVTGRVLSCSVEVGEQVTAGAPCGRLYGTGVAEVPVSIAAGDLEWLDERLLEAPGGDGAGPEGRMAARVEWQRPGGQRTIAWDGWVERIEAGLEAETRTATLVIRVDNVLARSAGGGSAGRTPGPMLEMNMFCKVTILGRKLPKVYVLPRQAIRPDRSVYVVVGGRLGRRPVKVARFTAEDAMILPGGGIRDGDRVVIAPVPKAVIGMAVEAVDALPSGGGTAPAAPGAPRGRPQETRR